MWVVWASCGRERGVAWRGVAGGKPKTLMHHRHTRSQEDTHQPVQLEAGEYGRNDCADHDQLDLCTVRYDVISKTRNGILCCPICYLKALAVFFVV